MLFEAKNILEPEVIRTMFRVRKRITQIESKSGGTWSSMCMQVPGNEIKIKISSVSKGLGHNLFQIYLNTSLIILIKNFHNI